MSRETERTVVKTYVPQYQKDVWQTHAEELGMSQSEFVRSMVQAGRRGFDGVQPGSADATPGGDDLETRLLEALSTTGYVSWDELVSKLSSHLETQLEGALRSLQADGRVQYNGPRGGYTLVGEADE